MSVIRLFWATLLGLFVGLSGTLIGGWLVLKRDLTKATQQGWLLGFSGGIMLIVVLLDLWPEAWYFGGALSTFGGSVIGMLLVQFAEPLLRFIPWYQQRRFSRFAKVGILLGLGIGFHNFPEGVALGTVFTANQAISKWMGLALLMALHNIPEGMVMAAALKFGKVSVIKIAWALFLVELPMAGGATLGAFLGELSPQMVALALGFAGGAMFLLVLKELIPLAKKIAGAFWIGYGLTIGALIGVLLVKLV